MGQNTEHGMRRERLGTLLAEAGLLDCEQVEEALDFQRREGGKLGEVLVRHSFLTEEAIADVLARQKGFETVDLTSFPVDRTAASLIPERVARLRHIIPIECRGDEVVLAMSDPLDIEAIDDVALRTGRTVRPVVTTETQVRAAIEKYVASADAFQDVLSAGEDLGVEDEVPIEVVESAPVVRLVNQIVREALVERASDVHIEPTAAGVKVRFRIDGVLHDVMELPASARAGVVSRIKVMAELNLAERRMPQDGRISLTIDGRPIDLRVATIPTPEGESVVIRVLNQGLTFLSLEDLGMGEAHLAQFQTFIDKPYGAVLVAGPTGSGKSTTLYAGLQRLNTEQRKIVSIEDPIEYRMAGVTQVAVNAAIGLSFAKLLRTTLRFDPDVVMVGEVRDPETAEIAVRAALTGHLVLSSIHTNDAPGTLPRLADMGVEPYLTVAGLLGVVAQRLARRLCPACKVPQEADHETLIAAGFSADEVEHLVTFRPVGCERCLHTGYSGRLGLFEIMPMTPDIVRMFLAGASADALRALAIEQGMIPLRRDALDKVAKGWTSLAEVDRVVL
jgi:type IV pilus assembly protein PilB